MARVGLHGGRQPDDKFFYSRMAKYQYLVYRSEESFHKRPHNHLAFVKKQGDRNWIAETRTDPTVHGRGESRFSAIIDLLQQIGES